MHVRTYNRATHLTDAAPSSYVSTERIDAPNQRRGRQTRQVTSRLAVGTPVPPAPMLATAGPVPTGDGWAYEPKWDGARCACRTAGKTQLFSRNAISLCSSFPEVLEACSDALRMRGAILDGEVIGPIGTPKKKSATRAAATSTPRRRGGSRSRSSTPPSPPAVPQSGVKVRPRSPATQHISMRSIRTSSPSTTPASAPRTRNGGLDVGR